MNLHLQEYLQKGIFLGLVLFAALALAALPAGEFGWENGLLRTTVCTVAGLALALLIGAVLKFREGYRVQGRPAWFALFVLLESPMLAYVGIIGGLACGVAWLLVMLPADDAVRALLPRMLLAGALGGLCFAYLRRVQGPAMRLGLTFALAAGLAAIGLAFLGEVQLPWLGITGRPRLGSPMPFAVQILVAFPFFWLLTLAGEAEESEAEIAILCGMLAVGLAILIGDNRQFASLVILAPLALFLLYTWYVLPWLKVEKHTARGFGYTRGSKFRKALMSFRRALQLEPDHANARQGFWEVHCSLDLDTLADDPQTLALVDLDLCLSRAGALLLQKPTPAQLDEANRLLGLVQRLQPARQPQVDYWRAVAATHARDLDTAALLLDGILDPAGHATDDPSRLAVLLPAWQLVLLLHAGLRQRVGEPQLAQRGRRMEAIAAVERHLAIEPQDQTAIELKKLLYRGLTEADHEEAAGEGMAVRFFDYDYAQHLGLSLINDDTHWQRGGEYLRIAACGLPALGPTLFVQIAQAQRRVGLMDEARHNYELAKRAGQSIGAANMAEAERHAYFGTVKLLGEDAMQRGDIDAAIENYHLYTESEQSGVATLRTLADLYEKKGDPLAAARCTDQALQYNSTDPDLLQRKDRYYYSILPEDLGARLEQFGKGFDFDYCIRKARDVLDRYTDLDWLDVARVLATLALVVRPGSLSAMVLLARVKLRHGERDEAIGLLEQVRGPAVPEPFPAGDDGEAWYSACQFLGELYLEAGKPEQALACLNDFRKSAKSGARTWFRMAQAYEALGDPARAKKCYANVKAYDGNPLASEAIDALARLG